MNPTKLNVAEPDGDNVLHLWLEDCGGGAALLIAQAGSRRQNLCGLRLSPDGLVLDRAVILPDRNPGIALDHECKIVVSPGRVRIWPEVVNLVGAVGGSGQ